MIDRVDKHVPQSKRLMTDDRSNILIYLTGHGGDGFLKFQDFEEMNGHDIADALAQMWEKKRYNEIMLMVETCQAASMYRELKSPNIVALASSLTGQSSYSHHADNEIGVAVIDRLTYHTLKFMENVNRGEKATLKELVSL
jgi:phosphatidylinositol glycan class K